VFQRTAEPSALVALFATLSLTWITIFFVRLNPYCFDSIMSFRFIPSSPTAAAYENKEFSDFHNAAGLFKAMKSKELASGKIYRGTINLKKDRLGEFDDTPMRIYNNPRWWESGASSCVRGCCKVAPEGYVIGTRLPTVTVRELWKKTYKDFNSASELEAIFQKITDVSCVDTIVLFGYGWFVVTT